MGIFLKTLFTQPLWQIVLTFLALPVSIPYAIIYYMFG